MAGFGKFGQAGTRARNPIKRRGHISIATPRVDESATPLPQSRRHLPGFLFEVEFQEHKGGDGCL